MAGRIAVIGSGSWGTAAAGLLAAHASDVRVWAHSPKVPEAINRTHRNPRHLKDYELPANVSASHDFAEVLDGAESMVMVVPSSFLRGICGGLRGLVREDLPIVVLTKGIEPRTHLLMADVVADVLGNPGRVAALSGPNHAEEICQGLISAAVVACQSEALAAYFQEAFVSQEFRVYRSQDIKGVEVCAAVKNVVAIACGICAGLGLGDNTLAVLMTRGLAEISRIVCAVGGDPMTCMGLAGMGDLVATCTSRHSRNRTFGDYGKGSLYANNLLFCALAGALWYSQFFGFGIGQTFFEPGSVVAAFAWCILMALNVTFSNVWGIILREWRGVSAKTVGVLVCGLAILIFSLVFPNLF